MNSSFDRSPQKYARIAAGDLTRPLPSLGHDEIGSLGRSFEAMRLALAKDETRRVAVAPRMTRIEDVEPSTMPSISANAELSASSDRPASSGAD
jgi:methyl-accepting chemotaxis protein